MIWVDNKPLLKVNNTVRNFKLVTTSFLATILSFFFSSDHKGIINIIVKALLSRMLIKFTYIILTQHLAFNRLSINAVMRKAIIVNIDWFLINGVHCSNIH